MRLGPNRILLSLALAVPLAACGEDPPPVAEQIRPIRTFTVTEVASGQTRRFSGVIVASDSTALSFQVGGNVLEVLVNQGDQVTGGQRLAVLDQEPYELDVKAAEADLEQAHAVAGERQAEFERQATLYEQGWVARARFDTAERDARSAKTRVGYAGARLNLAQRDLRNTVLAAPFDGFISSRTIDPFVEVQAGQELFQIDAEGGFEAAIGVPETSISEITLGMPVTVNIPQLDEPLEAVITEIGTAAGRGNVFPVKAALVEPPPSVRTGMTAEASVLLARQNEETGYLVPLSAVAAGDNPNEGFVFVYDPATSTVKRTLVKAGTALQGNVLAVIGIDAGDILASAGVNFMVDGQRVKLLAPAVAAAGS